MPAVVELMLSVEVPEPPTIKLLVRFVVRPVDGVAVTDTVPENPVRDVIVMVDVVNFVESTVLGVDAVRRKSCTLYVTVAVCDANPVLAAVRVTV